MSKRPQSLLQNIKESGLSAKTKKASTSHSLPSIKVKSEDKKWFDVECVKSGLTQWDLFHMMVLEAKANE